MINGLIGKKLKMTTSYDDDNGLAIPTTIISPYQSNTSKNNKTRWLRICANWI